MVIRVRVTTEQRKAAKVLLLPTQNRSAEQRKAAMPKRQVKRILMTQSSSAAMAFFNLPKEVAEQLGCEA